MHGANLMKAMKAKDPQVSFVGVGGPHMRAEGLECLREAETLSVVGFVEVLKNIRFFKRVLAEITAQVLERDVEAFIPIDYPGLNLRICERVKAAGVKVIFYICPQVWAWRQGRVHTIARVVDLMLTIFPFEACYFKDKDLRVEYVGHPLCDEIPVGQRREDPAKGKGRLAVMPGSRHSEIGHHLPTVGEFLLLLHQRNPELEVHIPCAQTLKESDLLALLPTDILEKMEGKLVVHPPGSSQEVLDQCHAALIASGTSTLQGVLSCIPFALFYRLNGFTFWLGKKLVKLRWVGLANLVAEKAVSRELLQDAMSAEALVAESECLLWDASVREQMYADFEEVHRKLGGPGASDRAAEIVLNA